VGYNNGSLNMYFCNSWVWFLFVSSY